MSFYWFLLSRLLQNRKQMEKNDFTCIIFLDIII